MRKVSARTYYFLTSAIIAGAGVIEYLMGRLAICKCGYVKLWESNIFSSGNSQHLADWYVFSHIIHGFAFYYFAKWLFPKKPLGFWLVFAVFIEAGWEILENSPLIINRYREGTISLDYYGDSILNSVMDILFAVVGFFFASRLPVWLIIVLIIIMEVGVMYFIRDNLTLNILMLLYPSEAVRRWQIGG